METKLKLAGFLKIKFCDQYWCHICVLRTSSDLCDWEMKPVWKSLLFLPLADAGSDSSNQCRTLQRNDTCSIPLSWNLLCGHKVIGWLYPRKQSVGICSLEAAGSPSSLSRLICTLQLKYVRASEFLSTLSDSKLVVHIWHKNKVQHDKYFFFPF